MIRNIGAVIAGAIVGSIANFALIQINLMIYVPPPEVDPNDYDQLAEFIGTLPDTAFLLPMVAHLAQSFIGGWIAARLGASHPMRLALIVGVLSLMGGLANMMMIPHPMWMWIEVPLYIAVAYGAGALEVKRRAGLASPS